MPSGGALVASLRVPGAQVLRRNGGPYGDDRGALSAEAGRRPSAFQAGAV